MKVSPERPRLLRRHGANDAGGAMVECKGVERERKWRRGLVSGRSIVPGGEWCVCVCIVCVCILCACAVSACFVCTVCLVGGALGM